MKQNIYYFRLATRRPTLCERLMYDDDCYNIKQLEHYQHSNSTCNRCWFENGHKCLFDNGREIVMNRLYEEGKSQHFRKNYTSKTNRSSVLGTLAKHTRDVMPWSEYLIKWGTCNQNRWVRN